MQCTAISIINRYKLSTLRWLDLCVQNDSSQMERLSLLPPGFFFQNEFCLFVLKLGFLPLGNLAGIQNAKSESASIKTPLSIDEKSPLGNLGCVHHFWLP